MQIMRGIELHGALMHILFEGTINLQFDHTNEWFLRHSLTPPPWYQPIINLYLDAHHISERRVLEPKSASSHHPM